MSVTGAPDEAAETYVRTDRVPVMGGRDHNVVDFSGDKEMTEQLRKHLVGVSLFTPLALLMLLVWLVESWLATMLKKRSRAVRTESEEKLVNDQ